MAAGGPAVLTGGAPLPGERPLGRPMIPKVESRGVPGGGLLAKGGKAPLPENTENEIMKLSTSYGKKSVKMSECLLNINYIFVKDPL